MKYNLLILAFIACSVAVNGVIVGDYDHPDCKNLEKIIEKVQKNNQQLSDACNSIGELGKDIKELNKEVDNNSNKIDKMLEIAIKLRASIKLIIKGVNDNSVLLGNIQVSIKGIIDVMARIEVNMEAISRILSENEKVLLRMEKCAC